MSSAPPETPAPAAPAARRRRSPWSLGRETERRSVQIGIAGTILIHLLLFWLGPRLETYFLHGSTPLVTPSDSAAERNFEIELAADAFVEEEPPPPQQFVEVNPDAPDNPPDTTDNFGARNQQLAQETPDPDNRGEMPATKGETEIDTSSIVTGTRSQPMPPVEAPPPAPANETPPNDVTEPAETPRLAQDPISGYEKVQGENEEGIGSNVVKLPENPDPTVEESVEGTRDPAVARPEARGLYYRPDPSRPQQRPQLAQSQIRPTILANRVDGTSNVGVIAHSALKTTYGEYLNRVIEVVDAEWSRAIMGRFERGTALPVDGSKVEVTFLLDKEGKVTISKVDGNAGQLWNGVAVEAIAAPARYSEGYGKWSDDMIAVLGDRQELVFTFFY